MCVCVCVNMKDPAMISMLRAEGYEMVTGSDLSSAKGSWSYLNILVSCLLPLKLEWK